MENDHRAAYGDLPGSANTVEANNLVNRIRASGRLSGSQIEEKLESVMLETQALQENMPNDVFIYRQDVVSCSKYEGLLGVVMEVAGDSDSDGSITDDSDSDDGGDVNGGDAEDAGNAVGRGGHNNNIDGDDENDSLPDGQVRVVWTDGSETTDNISDITVVDRSFLHGDVVASAKNPTGQLGLVVDVNITVDLLAANGEVIKHVSSKDLKRIREFTVGDYVVRGPWLGRVDDVLDNVTVLFDDGSICKVVKADPLRLQPVSKPVIDDAGCPYYPGQRIRAVSSSVFKRSKWFHGLWKATRLEGTVMNVQTSSVIVYWIASAHIGVDTNSLTAPPEEQNPKDLTLLDCFSYANWQLGDWCLFPSFNSVGTPKATNVKEPIEGSQVSLSLDRTDDIHIGIGTSTSSEGSVQGPYDTELDNKDLQLMGEPNSLLDIADDAMEYDSHNLPLVSGVVTNGSGSNASPGESKCNDTMALNKPIKAESNCALLDDGSCSISSSVSKETAAHESWPSYRKKLRKVFVKRDKKARRREETFERALFIINIMTKVDVAWQDGTKEYGLDSKSLIPIQTPNDHDFFPEQYVVEKASNEGDDSSEIQRVGIVRTLNAKDKTVCVRWFKQVTRPEDPREIDCDEIVSAYELDEHPDYDYCYGDVVVRLSPVPSTGSTTNLKIDTGDRMQSVILGSKDDLREKQSDHNEAQQASKNEVCVDFTNLSWLGNITGLQDGDIEVTWGDGLVSKVGPQAIYVVGRDDDGDSFGGGSEVSDDAASWETVDENDMNTLVDVEKKDDDLGSPTSSNPASLPEDSSTMRNGPLSMPLAALDYVTRLATGLFSLGKRQSDSECLVTNGTVPQENFEASDNKASTGELVGASNGTHSRSRLETEKLNQVVEPEDTEMAAGNDVDNSTTVGSIAGSTLDSLDGFRHFDVTENPLDHYYLGSNGQSTGGKKWVKKIQQEWSILEKNLPDAIFVRVFENRMDLLRAVIIGAAGTPYQDGLFFFDFHLPAEYPQVPPSAYYHSGGLRVNPNLYVDGKVCLSLLNTWTGKGNEVWDPSSSSILQVLVSLQGLVLNAKPYFNEAGYDKQVGTIEGEKNSFPYNENTYLLNLKSMMYLLRRPPMHFEGFVRDHFRRRGHYILKACEAYMNGCTIGSLTREACTTEKSSEHPCSVGFKLMLSKILPRLISALEEVGADCRQFEHLRKPDIRNPS